MANRRFNKQVANSRAPMKVGGRAMKMGGGMSTARKDMASGYYKDDMGMKGGAMYKKGGRVNKKNGSRVNDIEELGRVNAEKAFTKKGKKNLKAEKKRIIKKLNKA